MAYEFLKKLFTANDDGTTNALTYEELEKLIDGDNGLKIANIADGGYVDAQKHERIAEELKGVKKQLSEANGKIQEFKDMDIEGIKKAAEEYKESSEASIKELQEKLEKQDAIYSAKEFLNGYEFSSEFAKESVLNRFLEQGFKKDDSGKYLGAEDYMKSMKETHPDAFKADEPVPTPETKPTFAPNNGGNPPANGGKKMTLDEVMAYVNANPGTNIDALLDQM